MTLLITGITFQYESGYESGITSVRFNFTTIDSNPTYSFNGYKDVTLAEYNGVTTGQAGYVDLLKTKLVADIQAA